MPMSMARISARFFSPSSSAIFQISEPEHIYIAQPPLFSIKKGKDITWLYDEAALDKYKKIMG